jgi:predicted ATP-grasp superfamily ATP-dependent carboligase
MGLHVFLTQGLLPSALAAARCLTAAGHRVTLGDHDGAVIARFSRHVSRFVRLPPPAPNPRRYFDAVMHAVQTVRADVVLPLFEEGIVLAAFWDRQTALPACMPAFALALALADKGTGVDRAARAGLPVAATLPATLEAAELGRELGYPLVVKPRLATSGVGVQVARDLRSLQRLLAALPARADHVAQRWAGRHELVFQGVFDEGRCVAAHAYRVRCRHPPEHGFGILLESLIDEALLAHGIRLGEETAYHGALGVDFLADDDGVARVVEVNPRMVLGVVNAVDAGVQIPARAAELGRQRRDTVTARRPGYVGGVRTLQWPSEGVAQSTGQSVASQLVGWARPRLADPGALAAFLITAAVMRDGFDATTLGDRSLSPSLARRLREERGRAGP